MPAVLRQAVRNDLPDLFRVRYAVSENRLFSRAIPDDQVIEALEVTGRGWVIELDGVIVAFAIGNAFTGSLWALFVDPPHQDHGYGRRLHDTVVEWLWSRGLERVWLNTQPGTRAQCFYENLGWSCRGLGRDGSVGKASGTVAEGRLNWGSRKIGEESRCIQREICGTLG